MVGRLESHLMYDECLSYMVSLDFSTGNRLLTLNAETFLSHDIQAV